MLLDREKALLEKVSSDIGWSLVERFSRQPRAMPDEVCAGAGIIVEILRTAGIEPVVHEPEIYLGIPVSAEIVAAKRTFRTKATALSPAVDQLTAPLLYLASRQSGSRVHTRNPKDLFAQDFASEDEARDHVCGKLVITEGFSNPARTQLLQGWGAAGVIAINPGDRAHWGTNSTIWGSPSSDDMHRLPNIASLAVSRPDGDALIAMAEAGESATISVDALHGWFMQPIVSCEIGASDGAEEFVLLHGHYDSWEVGVGDNATGNALLVEVARLLKRHEGEMRRKVRFCWWPGHSAGRYAGSTWYADQFALDLRKNCVAHVNCDSPGCADATSYASVRGMSEAQGLVTGAVSDLFGQDCALERPGRAGDYSFNNLGISGCMLTSSMVPADERKRRGWYAVGGCGGNPAWHSEFDTMEIADRTVLENDIRLYALLATRLADSDLLPLDLRIPFAAIEAEIAPVLGRLDGAFNTRPALAALASVRDRLEALYAGASQDPTGFNQRVRKASRLIVRLGYTAKSTFDQDDAEASSAVPLLDPLRLTETASSREAKVSAQRALNAIAGLLEDIVDCLG